MAHSCGAQNDDSSSDIDLSKRHIITPDILTPKTNTTSEFDICHLEVAPVKASKSKSNLIPGSVNSISRNKPLNLAPYLLIVVKPERVNRVTVNLELDSNLNANKCNVVQGGQCEQGGGESEIIWLDVDNPKYHVLSVIYASEHSKMVGQSGNPKFPALVHSLQERHFGFTCIELIAPAPPIPN